MDGEQTKKHGTVRGKASWEGVLRLSYFDCQLRCRRPAQSLSILTVLKSPGQLVQRATLPTEESAAVGVGLVITMSIQRDANR